MSVRNRSGIDGFTVVNIRNSTVKAVETSATKQSISRSAHRKHVSKLWLPTFATSVILFLVATRPNYYYETRFETFPTHPDRARYFDLSDSIDRIVEYLYRIALETRPSNANEESASLRRALREGMNYVEQNSNTRHPFSLPGLAKGKCPRNRPKWMPFISQEQKKLSEIFRSRHSSNSGKKDQKVAIYYEHISKAGGTSFCKLAKSNMIKTEVPPNHCMPYDTKKKKKRKRGLNDALVGNWTSDEILDFLIARNRSIVANERTSFNPALIKDFRPIDSHGTRPNPTLLFLTSIRHPIDRLVSAYKFFWKVKDPEKALQKGKTIEAWIQRRAKLKRKLFTWHVSKFNFATWKFSNGKLKGTWEDRAEKVMNKEDDITSEIHELPGKEGIVWVANAGGETANETTTSTQANQANQNEPHWAEPFRIAVTTLSRFDLAIPTELLTNYPAPLQELLGWQDLTSIHVTFGANRVQNSSAIEELTKEKYDLLFDANWLDIVLHAWVTAIYLVRVHCHYD